MKKLLLSLTLFLATALGAMECTKIVQRNTVKPTVILLNGTSSAGKSSIGNELVKALENAVFIDEEGRNLNVLNTVLQKYNAQPQPTADKAMQSIARIPEADAYGEANYNTLYEKETLRLIHHAIGQGKHVILDHQLFTLRSFTQFCREIKNTPLFHVMAYCSPDKLLEHLLSRNSNNSVHDKRPIIAGFGPYRLLYLSMDITHTFKTSNLHHIDTLEQSAIKKVLADALQEARQSPDKRDKDLDDDFVKDFIEYFDLDQYQTVAIAPRLPHDLVVNTGIHSAEECAQKIVAAFK